MREHSNWFSKLAEELPPPEELMPLSQTLISPDLAIAFDITNPSQQEDPQKEQQQRQQFPCQAPLADEEPARTLKRPRLVWTPQLHKRFVDAVAHLGIKNAVPKTIMQLMSVDGLTRENVASHLQKYRLYLKRMQGLSAGAGAGAAAVGSADPATDRLFASLPVPPHFLHPAARASSDHYTPFLSVSAMQQQQQQQQRHHQDMAAAASHRHFGLLPPNGHFELPFLSRMGLPVPGYAEDMESGGRKFLTLFPAGDD